MAVRAATSPGKVLGPPPLPIRSVGDSVIDSELAKVSQAADTIASSNESVQGRVIYGVKLEAMTTTQIEHGLGNKPRSWIPCGLRNPAFVWQYGEADERIIVLVASIACTLDVRVW